MFDLFKQYYADVDQESFLKDLSEKNFIILLWDKNQRQKEYLFGFSTILKKHLEEKGILIFSGDTVVDKAHWGTKLLQKAFTQVLLRQRLKHPFTPLYWMLISKGFKTYLLMRRNFPVSFPNPISNFDQKYFLIWKNFYQNRYSQFFNPNTYLIDFDESRGRVKEILAQPTDVALKNKDVEYFVKTNSRYAEGVELACIADIRWTDIFSIGFKYLFKR